MTGRQISKGHATGALVLGIIELLLGIVVTICSFVLASKAKMQVSLTPYWAGLTYLVPGILGIVTGITKGHCAMIGNMIVNIIVFIIQGVACILIGVVVVLWAAYADGTCYSIGNDNCRCIGTNGQSIILRGTDTCDVMKTISTFLYVLLSLLAIAAVVTLAASILGCVAVCCSSNVHQPGMVIQQPLNMQSKQQSYKTIQSN